MKRRAFLILVTAFLLTGCEEKLTKQKIADRVIDYFMPYSSTEILVPQGVEVLEVKEVEEKKRIAKVCYTFRFLVGYSQLVEYIKKYPNSFLAKFDYGLVALLGRKFGNFHKNDIKKRCDYVTFELKKGRWVITQI